MSFEQTAYVYRAVVPARAALQSAIDALGFDCKLDTTYLPFQSSGFLPCVLGGVDSGFEIYFESAPKVLAYFQHLEPTVGSRDTAITFRWGGDMSECACALIVCAALAISFGAIVHYQNDDMIYSGNMLAEEVRVALKSL